MGDCLGDALDACPVDETLAKRACQESRAERGVPSLPAFAPPCCPAGRMHRSGLQVDTERWDVVHQHISTRQEAVDMYLEDQESLVNLEAVARSGTGKRRPRVRLDIAGAEYLQMEEVAVEFKPEQAPVTEKSSRVQLGYRTSEEVRTEAFGTGRGRDQTSTWAACHGLGLSGTTRCPPSLPLKVAGLVLIRARRRPFLLGETQSG